MSAQRFVRFRLHPAWCHGLCLNKYLRFHGRTQKMSGKDELKSLIWIISVIFWTSTELRLENEFARDWTLISDRMCVSNILFDTQSRLAVWLHIISVRSKLCSKVYDYRRPKTVTKGVTHTQVRVVDTQKQFSLYKRQPGIIGTKLQFLDAVAAAERFLIEARLCCEGVSLNVLEHNTYTQSMRMQRCKHTKIVIVGSSAQ